MHGDRGITSWHLAYAMPEFDIGVCCVLSEGTELKSVFCVFVVVYKSFLFSFEGLAVLRSREAYNMYVLHI